MKTKHVLKIESDLISVAPMLHSLTATMLHSFRSNSGLPQHDCLNIVCEGDNGAHVYGYSDFVTKPLIATM